MALNLHDIELKWRIREVQQSRRYPRGGFVAELGTLVPAGSCLMNRIDIWEAARFDTEKEAKAYVQRRYIEKMGATELTA